MLLVDDDRDDPLRRAEQARALAVAVPCTVTELTPSTFEKKPGAARDPVTLMVSFEKTLLEKVT